MRSSGYRRSSRSWNVDAMAKSRSKAGKVPRPMSILEASEFWDEHSLLDFPGIKEVRDVDIQIEREVYYCPVSHGLMKQLQERARAEGISTETLINLYLQEKLM
jgi:hypothetical protein